MADYVRGIQLGTSLEGCRRSNEESKPGSKHGKHAVYMGNRLGSKPRPSGCVKEAKSEFKTK